MRNKWICVPTFALALSTFACGSDAFRAAPEFPEPADTSPILREKAFESSSGFTRAPADFDQMSLALTFDVPSQLTTGTARIRFRAVADGQAFFLMTPTITAAKLDGNPVAILSGTDPDGMNTLRVIDAELTQGSNHELELEYTVPSSEVTYRSGGVGFITSMADIDNGNFFEAYGPANFEADQFRLTLDMNLVGASNSHQLFTNGQATEASGGKYHIEFPSYFNTSGIYVHLTDTAMSVKKMNYQGQTHTIPVTIYSQSASNTNAAFAEISDLFDELESTYGPYLHGSFTAYINGSGGMEHSGATITSLDALGHELLHSWFARGVMPADGRSGWIDEAVASWRDYGYQRATSEANRTITSLGDGSLFDLFTPGNAYVDGRALMRDWDFQFASSEGGMRPVLKRFFERFKGQIVTSDVFKSFLETSTGRSLASAFSRYVYGGGVAGTAALQQAGQLDQALHPKPLTPSIVETIR